MHLSMIPIITTKPRRSEKKKKEECLCGAHSSLEGGEAVVEGAENRHHVIRNDLGFLQRLSHQCGTLA